MDGAWLEKSARNDEAGAEITALLGMDREQFTRVVMLPQGDFAAFLRSKASDRLELLQKPLRHPALRSRGTGTGPPRSRGPDRGGKPQQQAGAARWPRPKPKPRGLGLDLDGAPGREDADQLLAWLTAGAAAIAGARHAAAADAEAAPAPRWPPAWKTATARAARQAKLAAAEQRKAAAEAAAPELQEKSERLGQHRKAEVLGGQLQAVDSAAQAEERAAAAAADASAELRTAAPTDPELAALQAALPAAGGPAPAAAR